MRSTDVRRDIPLIRAFTLLELLVVISLIALLLAIAAPSVNAIIRSTEEAAAKNQLDVAMSAARSQAVVSESGQDSAAVFFFTPGGKCSIGVFRKAGELEDVDTFGNPVRRDVFVPSGMQLFSLPTGWMIRGLAPVGTLHDESAGGQPSGWYEPIAGDREFEMGGSNRPWWNWVFPETGFYNKKKADEVADQGFSVRQTFLVRFEAGTGLVKTGDRTQVLVVDPSPSNAFRTVMPYRIYRFNRGEDVASVVRRVLESPESLLPLEDKQKLLGDQATDTVLAQNVTEIALYRETDLAAALGARGLNRTTRCLYGDGANPLYRPEIDKTLFASYSAADVAKSINEWFATDASDSDSAGEGGGFVYSIDRASGRPVEVR
ncbi:MAG: hypothetical protein AMXMBFR58_16100 [Phycisphaerae bacterium]